VRQSSMALALAATGDFLAAPAQPAVSALIGAVQGSRSSPVIASSSSVGSGSSSGSSSSTASGGGDRNQGESSWLRAAPRLDASQCMQPPEPFSSITSGPLLVGSVAGSGTTGVLSELQMVRYPSLVSSLPISLSLADSLPSISSQHANRSFPFFLSQEIVLQSLSKLSTTASVTYFLSPPPTPPACRSSS